MHVLKVLRACDQSEICNPVVIPDTVDMVNLLTVRDGTMNMFPDKAMHVMISPIDSRLKVSGATLTPTTFADRPIRHDLLNQPFFRINNRLDDMGEHGVIPLWLT